MGFDEQEEGFQWLANLCSRAEGARGDVMWGDELVYFVGGSMFCMFHYEGKRLTSVAFRPSPTRREEILARPGVHSAAFPADGGWVTLKEQACRFGGRKDGVTEEELNDWIRTSYELARAEGTMGEPQGNA